MENGKFFFQRYDVVFSKKPLERSVNIFMAAKLR
jgi:hypothetical protein